jgi:hypothetical protein
LIGLGLLAAVGIFAAGIVAAVTYAGLRPMEAVGVGGGGIAACILTAILTVSRWVRIGADMRSRADHTEWEETLDATDEVADQIADVEERAREPM